MKPYIHAQSSVKKWGGKIEDYLPIHNWFDQTKAHIGDNRHRAILHSSFGIFLAEQMFGCTITLSKTDPDKNAEPKLVCVRDIGEQHVYEDLGFIPSISDYLKHMTIQDWMCGKKTVLEDVIFDGSSPVKPTIDKNPVEDGGIPLIKPRKNPFDERVGPYLPNRPRTTDDFPGIPPITIRD